MCICHFPPFFQYWVKSSTMKPELKFKTPERLNKVIFIGLEYLILVEIKHERGNCGEFSRLSETVLWLILEKSPAASFGFIDGCKSWIINNVTLWWFGVADTELPTPGSHMRVPSSPLWRSPRKNLPPHPSCRGWRRSLGLYLFAFCCFTTFRHALTTQKHTHRIKTPEE